jgi:hypothetical protein
MLVRLFQAVKAAQMIKSPHWKPPVCGYHHRQPNSATHWYLCSTAKLAFLQRKTAVSLHRRFLVWKFGFTPIMIKKMLDKAVVVSPSPTASRH